MVERPGGFLPPEPAGPEPELGRPAKPEAAPPDYAPGPAPVAGPGPYREPAGPPSWGHPPPAAEPDNGPAVAGFVLSVVAVGLLFPSAGLSSLLSLGGAIAGVVYSRKGKRKVDAGETRKNAGLAQAGFVVGIVGLVLSALAVLFWVLILVLALADDEFQRDLERELDQANRVRASVLVARAVVPLLA